MTVEKCPEYLEWLRHEPCVVLRAKTGSWVRDEEQRLRQVSVEAAHVQTKRAYDDLGNAVSLDYRLHQELHQHGPETFARTYGVDLAAEAQRQTALYLATAPQGLPF